MRGCDAPTVGELLPTKSDVISTEPPCALCSPKPLQARRSSAAQGERRDPVEEPTPFLPWTVADGVGGSANVLRPDRLAGRKAESKHTELSPPQDG
jgi:hypothetical protein